MRVKKQMVGGYAHPTRCVPLQILERLARTTPNSKNISMPNYRRAIRPGGTFFLTLVTERRAAIFANENARAILRGALNRCREFHPFELDAIVLLHDHLHLLITLPHGDADFSRRITFIKSSFTRTFLGGGGREQARSQSRVRERTRGIWQRRFWEHAIRDETDRIRHLDYLHYNPVKHGYVACPHAWPHSSFNHFVNEGHYAREWCCGCGGREIGAMSFADIAKLAGE
jgi:putative transposase